MKQGSFNKIIAIVVLVILFLPMVQEAFVLFKIKPLEGEYEHPAKPTLKLNNWMNHQYQDSIEKYTKLHFGFSPFLTRLHNQFLYNIFYSTRNPSTVIGKKNEIYDFGHVQAYLGNDFIGETAIREKIDKIQKINDALKKFNTEIVIVLAPSKPAFLPEYLPNKYKKGDRMTNYSYYKFLLEKSKISYVDYSQVYKTWKNKKPYPLYPQCGVHWSEYGATLAADSMLRYIHQHLNTSGPVFTIDSVISSSHLSESDYDMGSTMNLLFPLQPYPMGYPKISIDQTSDKKLNILTVGDSYYWIWYNIVGFDKNFFKRNTFLEYYSKAHSIEWGSKDMNSINIIEESTQSDMVMIVCSESNLYRLGYGYIEDMYLKIPEINRLYQAKIEQHKKNISSDVNWLEQIKRKATERQISVDSMLTLDAIYIADHEKD